MAKPTTGAALAVVVLFYVLAAGKLNIRLLLLSGAVAVLLVLLSAWAIDGSVLQFARRLLNGAALADALEVGHDLAGAFRWDGLVLSSIERASVWIVVGAGRDLDGPLPCT